MLHNFCEVAIDFPGLLRQLRDPLKMRASEVVVQFPFTLPVVEEKTEEDLARILEKRKEQGRKLQEMAAKTRMEKVSHNRGVFVSYQSESPFPDLHLSPAFAERKRPAIPNELKGDKGYRE